MRPWLILAIRYLAFATAGNLVWELLQLPLYTLWYEASPGEIAFAVVHCTAGDILIAASSLALGVVVVRHLGPGTGNSHTRIATFTIAFGAAYTVFSEWMNVHVHGNWAYSSLMPMLPVVGTGLAPLAQWVVVPVVAFWLTARITVLHTLNERN